MNTTLTTLTTLTNRGSFNRPELGAAIAANEAMAGAELARRISESGYTNLCWSLLVHAVSVERDREGYRVGWGNGSTSTVTLEVLGDCPDEVTCEPSAPATTEAERRTLEPEPLRVSLEDLSGLRTTLGNGIRRKLYLRGESNIEFIIANGRVHLEAYNRVAEASEDVQNEVMRLWNHAVWIDSAAPYLTNCHGGAVEFCDAEQIRMLGLAITGETVLARDVIEAWAHGYFANPDMWLAKLDESEAQRQTLAADFSDEENRQIEDSGEGL